MSYGWARTEILGALINGTFLISLCLYVTLEAIPEYIQPSEVESGWYCYCGRCWVGGEHGRDDCVCMYVLLAHGRSIISVFHPFLFSLLCVGEPHALSPGYDLAIVGNI